MSSFMKKQGFSLVEGVIIVGVVGVIGLLGYTFYSQMQKQTASKTASTTQVSKQSPTATDVPAMPQINSAADLTQAVTAMDSSQLGDDTDITQLDSQSAAF
jgi:Tfp pilus assembly protein PilV